MIAAILSALSTPVAPGIWLGPQLLVLGAIVWAVSAIWKQTINSQYKRLPSR